MANTEDIEARLCAYIDGHLDARERGDIERHLASHPQHRELIEELTRQRDLLRRLPRESAPDDLYESITGHLERSILLDSDSHEHSTAAGASNRWSQIYAVAAVLLLAIGLAAVILFVLPRHSFQDENLAIAPATTRPVTLSTAGAPVSAGAASAVAARGISNNHSSLSEQQKQDVFAQSRPNQTPQVSARKNEFLFATGSQSTDLVHPAKPAAIVLTINTRDPAAAGSEVTHFLQENQITWQNIQKPSPPAQFVRDIGDAQMDRVAKVRVALKQPMPEPAATMPADTAAATSQPLANGPSATTQALVSATPERPLSQSSPGPQEIYLARNITEAQLADLKACIATLEVASGSAATAVGSLRQGAQATTAHSFAEARSAAAAPTATQPTSRPDVSSVELLKTGDLLSVADSRSDQVSIQSIDADGQISLPDAAPITVAGLSIDQARDTISKALRTTAVERPAVTLRIIAPATRPLIQKSTEERPPSPTRMGLAEPSRQTPAGPPVALTTTRPLQIAHVTDKSSAEMAESGGIEPTNPSTQPAEPRMDVVIVVQPGITPKSPSVAATQSAILSAQPATRPATNPSP